MALFGKVVDPFRGEASLEKVSHWLPEAQPSFLLTLCFLSVDALASVPSPQRIFSPLSGLSQDILSLATEK